MSVEIKLDKAKLSIRGVRDKPRASYSGSAYSFLFSLYILHILGGRKNKKLRVWYIAAVLNLALSEILIIVSQFTDWVYFVDENTMYHRGEFFWLSSMLACVSLISNIIVILLHKKHLSRKDSIALELYIWIMVAANIASLPVWHTWALTAILMKKSFRLPIIECTGIKQS